MAEDKDLELDVNQAKGSKMTNILLITLIVLVLIVGGVGAFMFSGDKEGKSDSGSDTASSEKAEKSENKDPLLYITLVPEFVVNFGPGSEVRYLQIDLQAASRQQEAFDAMNLYMPVIRNDVLVLLSGQTFENLKTRAGKELIQQRILNTINTVVNSVLAKKDGENNNEKDDNKNNQPENKVEVDPNAIVEGPIESVYFLSFIMQ